MKEYIGLDVSLKETAVSIRRDGKRMWRGKCASDPKVIAELVRKRAPAVELIVFETGPLSVWFYKRVCLRSVLMHAMLLAHLTWPPIRLMPMMLMAWLS